MVTGAGSPTGIGFACAQALAPTHDLLVAATSSRIDDRVAELTAVGAKAVGFIGDLSDSSTALRLVSDALEHFGRLDVLVNNAGMTATTGSEEQTPAELTSDGLWHAAVSRNLDTNFFTTRAALAPMTRQAFGRIVNVGSVSGSVMAYRGDAAYHAAKAALVGLTRSIAIDYADQGITANVVAPGWITTGSATEHENAMERRLRWGARDGPTRSRPLSHSSPPLPRPTSPARSSSSTVATRSPRSAAWVDDQLWGTTPHSNVCKRIPFRNFECLLDGQRNPQEDVVVTRAGEKLCADRQSGRAESGGQ